MGCESKQKTRLVDCVVPYVGGLTIGQVSQIGGQVQ